MTQKYIRPKSKALRPFSESFQNCKAALWDTIGYLFSRRENDTLGLRNEVDTASTQWILRPDAFLFGTPQLKLPPRSEASVLRICISWFLRLGEDSSPDILMKWPDSSLLPHELTDQCGEHQLKGPPALTHATNLTQLCRVYREVSAKMLHKS